MLKFRFELEFFRALVFNRINYSTKCKKMTRLINTSLIDYDFRNYHFTQAPRISSAQITQCNINDKGGDKYCEDTVFEKCLSGRTVDVQSVKIILKKLFEWRSQHISTWLIEKKLNDLCRIYASLSDGMKNEFFEELTDYSIFDHLWLFSHIGKMERGPGYLVKLREDLIDLIAKKKDEKNGFTKLHELNGTLRELLSIWFSQEFLELKRITWKSSSEILEKISKYERVHPVRNRMDLRRRLGPYRRCFIFLHRSMPDEPIIILHVALTNKISNSLTDILSDDIESSQSIEPSQKLETCGGFEDVTKIKSAIFYSLSSTQKGLSGIGASYYLICRVGREIKTEFPEICEFSTLSPIHTFKVWLLRKLEKMKSGHNDILFPEEMEKLQDYFKHFNFIEQLIKNLSSNNWIQDDNLCDILQKPLMRLCARYLYLEKSKRGYAIDSAANLHMKNGAVMWRINWMANPYQRGLNSSFGIMVNYRYYFDDMEIYGKEYQEEKKIIASDQIIQLANSAEKLILNPTVRSKI